VRFAWGHEVVGERVRAAGVPDVHLRLRADGDLPGLLRLTRALHTHRADALLATRWREFLLGGFAARLARTPRTVCRLGLKVTPEDDLKRRLIFGLADRVIVNAEEIRAALLQRPWIAPEKVAVVHNGVDLERYAELDGGAEFRAELGVPAEAPLVVNVGALTPQKDHATLVRATARLAAALPDVHVAAVGEGFLRADIESQVARAGVGDRFHLVGFRADVRPALAAADLFVLSSYNEGMPWAMIEAVAAGLPVVATDVSGTRACVDDGVNGLIVPERDDAALAAACTELLADRPRREAMARASRRLAAERFDENRMFDQTLQILAG
jgi:glycosyltransferase involved in cell wall biosynthesis